LVGLPGFFGGIAIATMSVLPYIGSFLVWGPVMIYMASTGAIPQAIILLVAGVILSTGDNILRAFIIKGKAQAHELLIFFSLIGGITMFGFWGIVLGPLIFSLFLTVLHIYEAEFGNNLEKALD
ncbi:AI-2E family transporter, partial [Candidatus Falkowbacteria bacterium]|nr:AI-2E family transporter [Candidatus Falkowbacteria bacterium]